MHILGKHGGKNSQFFYNQVLIVNEDTIAAIKGVCHETESVLKTVLGQSCLQKDDTLKHIFSGASNDEPIEKIRSG